MKSIKKKIPESYIEDLKNALENSDAKKTIELANTYDIKHVAFDDHSNPETPFTMAIPDLFDKIKKWALELFENQFQNEKVAIHTVLYHVLKDKSLYNDDQFISDKAYLFLRKSSAAIIQELKQHSRVIPLEPLETTQDFVLILKEKLNNEFSSQIEIVSFFISTYQIDPNYLLVQAFDQFHIDMVLHLIKNHAADFNAHTNQLLIRDEDKAQNEEYFQSPIGSLVENACLHPLIATELLSILLQHGLNPNRRYAYSTDWNLNIPWISLEMMLALQKYAPLRLRDPIYDSLYQQIQIHQNTDKSKLAICLGMHQSQSSLYKLQTDPLFDKNMITLIFTMTGFGGPFNLDSKPIERFKNKNYTLLQQEIKNYNTSACSVVGGELKLPLTLNILIFQYADINPSAHFRVIKEMEQLDALEF